MGRTGKGAGIKNCRVVTARMHDEETRAAYPCVSRRERRSRAVAGVVMTGGRKQGRARRQGGIQGPYVVHALA